VAEVKQPPPTTTPSATTMRNPPPRAHPPLRLLPLERGGDVVDRRGARVDHFTVLRSSRSTRSAPSSEPWPKCPQPTTRDRDMEAYTPF
jgi:hypothetical protein